VVVAPFDELVSEHGATVWRVCRAVLDDTDADDAWSETFLAALGHLDDLRPDSNVRGWLVTIAHRKAIDVVRRRNRLPVPTDDATVTTRAGTDGIPEPPDTDLWAAVAALPDKQRGAVLYHHVAGLPYAEVGPLLDCSTAAARRSAADGIAKLRAHLEARP
jgi:RNA polymerase sigma factor (sigma-70 family)